MRNRTNHTEITTNTGEVFVESHRNSIGGWANMVRRIEQRFGGTMRPTDDTGRHWECNGVRFTTQPVQTI